MAVANKQILELLAPAKDKSIGIAAIDCGADAVYIAGPCFGARKDAGNSVEDIAQLCDYAHKFGVHIFVTLNTIIYDNEIEQAKRLIKDLEKAGVDAFIIQDLALMELGISIPIHASTQCSIREPQKAKFYEDIGISRIVPERAMSLAMLKRIRKTVNLEIEFFVHGALCVCYSGQCYISEQITRRSANRGECSQACRSLYDLIDSDGKTIVKNKALLSLKDYKLLHRLQDLAEAGVNSFKIEGRLKNISYVKNVVREYSQALNDLISKYPDKYQRASWGECIGGFTANSNKTFNRGYTELFLDNKRGEWSSKDAPKSMGEVIGKVNRVKQGKIELKIFDKDIKLNNGDGFAFVNRSEITGFRGDVCSGNQITSRSIGNIKQGTTIYRNINMAFEKELSNNMPDRLINIYLDIDIQEDKFNIKAISDDGRKVESNYSFSTEIANNKERMLSLITKQLSKRSEHYIFTINKLSTSENLCLISSAELNSIRRDIAEKINDLDCIAIPLYHKQNKEVNNLYKDKDISYKENVSNRLSREFYAKMGAKSIESAFELSHKKGAELMRMKYCIKYEIGLCPTFQNSKPTKPLFLVNNGRRFALNFDCNICEMSIVSQK